MTDGYLMAIPLVWASSVPTCDSDAHVVAEFDYTILQDGPAHPYDADELLDAIDFFVAGPLGAAMHRCVERRDLITLDRLLLQFSDTGRRQSDIRQAVAIARKLTRSHRESLVLVHERVCISGENLARRPERQRAARVVGEVLLELGELEGDQIYWAVDRALDGHGARELIAELRSGHRLPVGNNGTRIRYAWLVACSPTRR